MKNEDQFSGRSWLNILAVVTLLTGLFFPLVSGHDWPSLVGVLMWYLFVAIVTACIVSAARTQERLARIEDKLGIEGDSETEIEKSSKTKPENKNIERIS